METPVGSSKKPLWTEEFSVQASEDKYVLRRQFSKFLVLTSFGMLAGNVWIWAKSLIRRDASAQPAVRIASVAALVVGDVKLFLILVPTITAFWGGRRQTNSWRTARSALIFRVLCITRRNETESNALATEAIFLSMMDVYCKLRPRGRCSAFRLSREGAI